MKNLEEVVQLLSKQEASDPVARKLNEVFGYFGWESHAAPYAYPATRLKVMVRVGDNAAITVEREAGSLAEAAATFGLEVKDEAKEKEATPLNLEPANGPAGPVGADTHRVEGVRGESDTAVPTGTPKPSRKVILDSITECSRVILAKKLRTQDQLVKMVEAFAVKRKEELNEAQAIKLLDQLTEITKEGK